MPRLGQDTARHARQLEQLRARFESLGIQAPGIRAMVEKFSNANQIEEAQHDGLR